MNDDKLEKIIALMEDGKCLSDGELAELMQDEQAVAASKDIMAMKAAVRGKGTPSPDVSMEWTAFKDKMRVGHDLPETTSDDVTEEIPAGRSLWTSSLWGWLAAAAAVVAVLVVMTLPEGKSVPQRPEGTLVFEHSDEPQEIVFTKGAGEKIDLKPTKKTLTDSGYEEEVLDYTETDALDLLASVEVESHTVSLPRGKDLKIILSDGTEVWLYADSKIIYPNHFIGKRRSVMLHGQAYFKVAKDAEHPFVIRTDGFEVCVLGTELNVRSSDAGNGHVALINGSVLVRQNVHNEVKLVPGQEAKVTEKGMQIDNADMEKYEYWRNGYLYFENKPLVEIMQELGRWYNLDVVFADDTHCNTHITYMCMRSESVDEAVELLNSYGKFRVERTGNSLVVQ